MSGRFWGLTAENLRHVRSFVRFGRRPAEVVYDSIGANFPLAPAPGWLNLGLWEDPAGPESEAQAACERLVETLAASMPTGGTILDVGNGLGAQDPVIAQVARPRRLVAVNITASQLAVGRERLARAGALAVRADAVLLPVADTSVDGVICVEAAFHFSSRARFFNEAFRVLRPGGVLALSDVPILRLPGGPRELLAGIAQLRVWGIRASGVVNAKGLEGLVRQAGFVDVRAERCGSRVIDPAIRLTRRRLATADLPWLQRSAARVAVGQVERLRRNGILEYVLLWARKPGGEGGSMG